MSTGRLVNRSTHTPACSATRMNGENSTADNSPTSKVLTFSTVMAMRGMASRLTWLPILLTVSPPHSFMKSPWRHKLLSCGRIFPVSDSDWEKSIGRMNSMKKRQATAAEAKALANPLRLRILRLCLDEALTNKELADRLDKDPGTLLHHVRTLVDTGFLAPDEVRSGTSGALE